MIKKCLFHNSLSRWLARFAGDRRGVSAIEFSLVFPIMITLLAGTVDFGQVLMVDRKINQVVATTTYIVAQPTGWTATNVDSAIAGAASIIEPFDTSDLKIVLAVVNMNSSGVATVSWSRGYNTPALAVGAASPVTIPVALYESGVQMVVAKATFSLSTPFASLLQPVTGVSTYNYTRNSIDRPRMSDTITLN
jgi:Flp pilus assembly protein TadG